MPAGGVAADAAGPTTKAGKPRSTGIPQPAESTRADQPPAHARPAAEESAVEPKTQSSSSPPSQPAPTLRELPTPSSPTEPANAAAGDGSATPAEVESLTRTASQLIELPAGFGRSRPLKRDQRAALHRWHIRMPDPSALYPGSMKLNRCIRFRLGTRRNSSFSGESPRSFTLIPIKRFARLWRFTNQQNLSWAAERKHL